VDKTILLLHGWPGTARDHRRVLELLPADVPALAPDLLGFGSAFHGPVALEDVTADAHARRLLDTTDGPLVVAGYDVGSRVAQATSGEAFDALVADYARPGAFTASVAWYSANPSGSQAPIDVATIVLWGDRDPLFPAAWAESVPESFTDAELRLLPGAGHFLPLEAPQAFADAVRAFL
jgi:pimeloyl-ACP methyl ester carboxylesterase